MVNYRKAFALKPLETAKISEISEKTASSNIPASERINFHIGNPVQDERLLNYYYRACIGVDVNYEVDLDLFDSDNLKENSELIYNLIKNSVTYAPRGGYSDSNPNKLIKKIYTYLNEDANDPLEYKIEKRECIITTGGLNESLRIFLFALSKFLLTKPIKIIVYDLKLPEYLKKIDNIEFVYVENKPNSLFDYLNTIDKNQILPHFLLLGSILSEKERWDLRNITLSLPLFIVETNNAPNKKSLAREAKLENRVLRFLTAEMLNPQWKDISIVFVAGNSNYLKIIETIHFQLLGTPSASEIELLANLWQNKNLPEIKIDIYKIANQSQYNSVNSFEALSQKLTNKYLNIVDKSLEKFNNNISTKHFNSIYKTDYENSSNFELVGTLTDQIFSSDISKKLIYSFIKHHPEYEVDNSLIISGSARTALGLLGFHCGIEEVVIPDLSWTYEHCFKKIHTVSMKTGIKLDDEAIILKVKELIANDPKWNTYGAVVINNPHNASGKVFPERKIINLIKKLSQLGVRLIDDLSYQNVAPSLEKVKFNTIKEITKKLVSSGEISQDKSKLIISVHSLSKTDCFAGARLCIVNINDSILYNNLKLITKSITPNLGAIITAYLFYKNDSKIVNNFWDLRNQIFYERISAIEEACKEFSTERNIFDIQIIPPTGSMYPQLVIEKLPKGLSLDWLSSNLASQGIGLIPLSTFARTQEGFELARKTFRLTLGGSDGASELKIKTRKLLINFNKLIAEEASKNLLFNFPVNPIFKNSLNDNDVHQWMEIKRQIVDSTSKEINNVKSTVFNRIENKSDFIENYLLKRIDDFFLSYSDKIILAKDTAISNRMFNSFFEKSKKEFFKDNLDNRKRLFNKREYDRTVHPTQVYSLKLEILFEELIDCLINKKGTKKKTISNITNELINEYLGKNISIKSIEEANELILDLRKNFEVEDYIKNHTQKDYSFILSFWGDWDGSNRPSGQGHRLVAATVLENVKSLCSLIYNLENYNTSFSITDEIRNEIKNIDENINSFWDLLNQITTLTHQLEKRYHTILPYKVNSNPVKIIAQKLKIMKEPLMSSLHHNDRLEKKMLDLRNKRKQKLEYYFSLNKKLRKMIFNQLEMLVDDNSQNIIQNYKSYVKRFVLTPRIHQKLITSKDQFAIDTTVHNIMEINEIGAKNGNPGLVLALQISMSNNPDALIALDRKLRSKRDEILRENPELEIPNIWIIPLFEDIDAVTGIDNYLNKLWDYCIQSRLIGQKTADRFTEMICEIFIAGSDLSQQVSQSRSTILYNEVKYKTIKWLSEKGIANKVRMKLGSGEPMQRQGGYYNEYSGKNAFLIDYNKISEISKYLKPSTIKATEYAVTPLLGIYSTADLRTLQSNICEKLRYLPIKTRAEIIYHLSKAQQTHLNDLIQSTEPITETRLKHKEKSLNLLKRITLGDKNKLYDEFIKLSTENFKSILYGSNEDLLGIHLISYFISRTTPTLRDRPTVRPSKESSLNKGQTVIDNIAKTIPMNVQGTALRAISHNHAQTLILGVNQLTTGLFRAMSEFVNRYSNSTDALNTISEIILPNLPVYEILLTLKYYQNRELKYLKMIEPAFKAGNSAFVKLREDDDAMHKYIGIIQKELLRRHGISTTDFFTNNKFNNNLLPYLRPDLAVLMQSDFFNNDIEIFIKNINFKPNSKWLNEVKNILEKPKIIEYYRNIIWSILKDPIFNQAKSFSELAFAINSFTKNNDGIKVSSQLSSSLKLNSNLVELLKGRGDDNMKVFLQAAVQYLSSLPESYNSIPIDIIRALKDVESILKIEEQALSKTNLELYNYCSLQIARTSGENG